ncbi:MAG: hypothetical protein ACFFAY_03405 [Promethearchaeota archaeon]
MSKKRKQDSKIRGNPKIIIAAIAVVAIFSGLSFYLGMATPHSFSLPIVLSGSMTLSLDYQTSATYGPFHTGVRVTFEVTDASHPWTLSVHDSDGNPVGSLSSSTAGLHETTWLYSPNGCTIWIHSTASVPAAMNLDGTLTITSSRFPFI